MRAPRRGSLVENGFALLQERVDALDAFAAQYDRA
jgi:hypothetical protein